MRRIGDSAQLIREMIMGDSAQIMLGAIADEREDLLGVINRLRQLNTEQNPNIEMAIANLHDARRWLLKELRVISYGSD